MMKVMCMYLPQYHAIKENDEWWGNGYTEWTAVKKAKPMFPGHIQPKIPLDDNYYDLVHDGVNTWKWQAELAKKYGIYGFCIYHYWFEGKQLLEKPMELLRDNPDIDIPYSICWANETWRRTWYGQKMEILMEQTYGDEQAWNTHFEYLLTFFNDKRYIKIQNKPLVHIYHTQEIQCLEEMLSLWNHLAVKAGFDGIYIVSGITSSGIDKRDYLLDAYYYFEPGYTLKQDLTSLQKGRYHLWVGLIRAVNKFLKQKRLEHVINASMIWKRIENRVIQDKSFPGTFPQWDNTPRTGNMGLYYEGTSPENFRKHLMVLKEKFGNKDTFLYINAWNEWGEGAYLEPDSKYKYEYLEAVSWLNKG